MYCTVGERMLNVNDKLWFIEDGVLKEYRGGSTEIDVPEGVTSIERTAFAKLLNKGPLKIKLPKTLKIIGDRAFKYLYLEEIELPDSLEEIGAWAFEYTFLEKIEIPANVKSIGYGAFADTQIKELYIADNVECVSNFKDTYGTAVRFLIVDNENGLLNLMKSLHSQKVDYLERLYLRKFPIDSSILREIYELFPNIEILSYYDCLNDDFYKSHLTTFNAQLSIENGVLSRIEPYNDILKIPDGVRCIENRVISYKIFTAVELPDSLLEIGDGNFYESTIDSITLPPNLEILGANLFVGCNLKELRIPKRVRVLGEGCLASSDIEKLIVTDYLAQSKSDLEEAFPYSLKVLVVENYKGNVLPLLQKLKMKRYFKLEKLIIDKNALDRDDYERVLKLVGPGVTIENGPYNKDEGKETLDDAEFVIKNGVLVEYRGVNKNITLPEGVKEIAPLVFAARDVESVILPSTLEVIGSNAFADNFIRCITFPKSLRKIGEGAFQKNLLHSVSLLPNLEFLGSNAFTNNKVKKLVLYDSQVDLKGLNESFDVSEVEQLGVYNMQNKVFDLIACLDFKALKDIIVFGNSLSLRDRIEVHKILGFVNFKSIKLEDWEIEDSTVERKPVSEDEMDEILSKLKVILEEINPEDRRIIDNQIQSVVKEYEKQLGSLKPVLSFDKKISLDVAVDPEMLKATVLTKLNNILTNLSEQKPLYIFANEIEYYKSVLDTKMSLTSESAEDNLSKIVYTLTVSSVYKIASIKEDLTNLVMETDEEITKLLQSADEARNSMAFQNLKMNFSLGLEKISLEAQRYEMLQKSLSGIGSSNLANDIRMFGTIIDGLDSDSKRVFKMELAKLQNKYRHRVVTDTLQAVELDFRQEFDLLLKKLDKVVNKVDGKKNVLDDLNDAKTFLEGKKALSSNQNVFINIIEEIRRLAQSPFCSEDVAQDIDDQIFACLDKWSNNLRNGEVSLSKDDNQLPFYQSPNYLSFDMSTIAYIKIGAELYDIKNTVEVFIRKNSDYAESKGM